MECGMIAAGFFALGVCAETVLQYFRAGYGERKMAKRQRQEQEKFLRAEGLRIQTMEEIREELAKIRHDFNNQLAAAYRLTEQGETRQARELLDGLRNEVAQNKEYTYCGNGIVNAVLIEKAEFCKKAGIRLQLDLNIYEEPGIRPMHLCSVFSNLLDNAIQAVGGAGEQERFVTARASRKGDYLHVKVENPVVPVKPQTGRKRGYGHEILKEIAGLYEGEFWTRQKDGMYTACISLLVEGRMKEMTEKVGSLP